MYFRIFMMRDVINPQTGAHIFSYRWAETDRLAIAQDVAGILQHPETFDYKNGVLGLGLGPAWKPLQMEAWCRYDDRTELVETY